MPRFRIPTVKSVIKYGGLCLLTVVLVSVIMILPLRWINPPTSSFILQADQPVELVWVDLEEISPFAAIAVVAAEDQKFPFHSGFDFESISEALADSVGPRRGASTISQQLAKNLYLWRGKSLLRKGIEAYLTVLLELFLPKRRILELYLNLAQFDDRVFGIGSASRHHFSTTAFSLSQHQAALLAAVLPNPVVMSASSPSSYVRQRAATIQNAIRYLGGPDYLKDLKLH